MKTLTTRLYVLLCFLAVFLPAGSIFGVNLKLVVFICFVAAFTAYLFSAREPIPPRDVIAVLLTIAFLLAWTLIGILRGHAVSTEVLAHLREIASSIAIAWFGIVIVRRKLITPGRLVSVVALTVFAMSCMKLLAVSLTVFSGFDAISAIQDVFGAESITTGDIVFSLFRVQFPSDIICPFALFALLAPNVSGVRFNRTFSVIATVVILASGFLTYSRYNWMIFAAVLLTALMIRRNWKLVSIAAIAVAALSISLTEAFGAVYESRFLSAEVAVSDAVRAEQYQALLAQIISSPFLGAGIGAHVNGVIRSDAHPYSYELQWVSLLMQFGVVGMTGLLLLIWASVRDLLKAKHPAKWYVCAIFALWLLASATNPYLTSSFAGVVFAFFMAMFYRMRACPVG